MQLHTAGVVLVLQGGAIHHIKFMFLFNMENKSLTKLENNTKNSIKNQQTFKVNFKICLVLFAEDWPTY